MSSEFSCELQERWKIDHRLADKLDVIFEQWSFETRIPIEVISGFRTDAEQLALGRSGRPAAPVDLSTHTMCPATGVDVRIGTLPINTLKVIFGRIAFLNGLRVGGGGPVDDDGIFIDWNHVDLGPRNR